MIVGVPRETKDNENRVAIVPAGASALTKAGHRVLVEEGAGVGSGITDEEYRAAGAEVVPRELVFEAADLILKVKEPLPPEYGLFREGQVLFTYLHLAPDPQLTQALIQARLVGIAYETVQLPNGSLPLLTPMSEVAGRMAPQVGAYFLQRPNGGRGVLPGGVPGVPPAEVSILGGGVVGTNAAKIALGLGASVVIVDVSAERLRYLDDIFGGRVVTVMSNEFNVANAVRRADIVIGAVLIPGARAPKLVTEDMVRTMKPGSVIVDVSVDQGGSVETIDRVTTHSEPTYVKHGVVHYAVANMPGAVPRTSTFALTNVTLAYALALANKGWRAAVRENPALARGVNVCLGAVTHQAVADSLGIPFVPLEEVA